jgi:hypothetical protein
MLRSWRLTAMSLAAVLGVAAAIWAGSAPAAGAGAAAGAQAAARPGKLSVGVEVLQFSAAGRTMSASGQVTAKLTDNSGHVTTVHTRVALIAASGGNCRVLHLFLNELTLSLLGLHAHLDKVQLDVTGDPHGGVLGSLFCKLARAKVARARASAARALNQSIRRGHGHAVRFTAYLRPAVSASQAAVATCPVLDLVVGPLDLKLLGLVVDLNRVHLVVTATRGQGALGDLFCKLADNTLTTTT